MVTISLSASNILEYAASLPKGYWLHTLFRQRPFAVIVRNGSLRYIMNESRKEVSFGHNLDKLTRFCEVFSECNSLHPTDYFHVYGDGKEMRGFSYLLPLVIKVLANQVDGAQ